MTSDELRKLAQDGVSLLMTHPHLPVGRLIDGMRSAADEIDRLTAENERLKEVIRVNDLCHDKDQNVGPREYADGCTSQQRKLFGCAPDADEVVTLRQRVAELEQDAKRYRWMRDKSPFAARPSDLDSAIDAAMEAKP